ncbi:nucleoporin Nup107 [Acrasis kona]|uniref:Nuclear pore complex protein n=1 Tax=Acrasis kona TaxID=1008807 RepID=A0AAW2YRZ8_9EUKA
MASIYKCLGMKTHQTTVLDLSDIYNKLKNETPTIRAQSFDTFHQIQQHISLNEMIQLVNLLSQWCDTPDESRARFYEHLVRISTHLVLFIEQYFQCQHSEWSLPTAPMEDILIAYIHYLKSSQQYLLVPYYTRFISNVHIRNKAFAAFIYDLNVDAKMKKKIYKQAAACGLDMNAIIKELITRSLESDRSTLIIQWMDHPDRYVDALVYANILIRDLIRDESKGVEPILDLIRLLPQDIMEVVGDHLQSVMERTGEISDKQVQQRQALHEQASYRKYLSALDTFKQFDAHQPPHQPKWIHAQQDVGMLVPSEGIEYKLQKEAYDNELQSWKQQHAQLARAASEQVKSMLEFVSRADSNEEPAGDYLNNFKQYCIPNGVFMLCRIYQSVGSHSECLDLAEFVADEAYQLYKWFTKKELSKLMFMFGTSEVAMLARQ